MMALWIILGCTLGGGSLGLVGVVCALILSGQLSFPGTKINAVKRAKQDAEIAQLDFERSQAIVNRQIMEARANEDIERIHEEGYQRSLTKGDA